MKVTHNAGGSTNLTFGCGLAWNLGIRTTYPPDPTVTVTVAVPAGASGYTADYRPAYLWCPETRIHATGPKMFDPYTQAGIRTSVGTTARSSDMTPSSTKNGEQVAGQLTFIAVEGLYRAREPDLIYGGDVHEREAFETFWRVNLSEGKRFFVWRDKSTLIGATIPSGAGTNASTYFECVPDDATRNEPQMVPSNPDDLFYWTITIGYSLTDRGTDVY